MAGSLFKISEVVVSSGVSSVSITGIDSTYDVYKLLIKGLTSDTDSSLTKIRVTKSGTPDTNNQYDESAKQLKAYTTFANNANTNQTEWGLNNTGTNANSYQFVIMYLYNFANANEFSFVTIEENTSDTTANVRGKQGGGVHTVASASDGIHIFLSTGGNIDGGTFTLYGLKK